MRDCTAFCRLAAAASTSDAPVDWEAWWARQQQTGRMSFANWPFYIDTAEGNRKPSLERFTRETGIPATMTSISLLATLVESDLRMMKTATVKVGGAASVFSTTPLKFHTAP